MKTPIEKLTTEQVARKFSSILKRWLTKKQMRQVIRTNSKPENAPFCATHEFCDANMAMIEAVHKLTGKQPDIHCDATNLLWTEAWAMAKRKLFYIRDLPKRCQLSPAEHYDAQIPPKVLAALKHVRKFHPEIRMVTYNIETRWCFADEDFNVPTVFDRRINIGILEDAQSSLTELPCVYQMRN